MKKTVLSLLFLCLLSLSVTAQKEKLQVSYIYQFTKLIEWCPEYKTSDFVIGILGSGTINKEMEALSGKLVASQKIVIKTFETPESVDKCNILFIPLVKSNQLNAVNKKIRSKCTLVVTEKDGLIKSGSSINFTESAGKLFFEVNKTTMVNHNLTASAKLLSLAKAVYQLNE